MSAPEPLYPRSATVPAAASLLVFGGISLLLLAAWLSVAADVWTWRSLLVLVCGITGAADGAWMLLRGATPAHVAGGLTVMLLSTLRVGDPWEWNWASWTILIGTLVLAIPLVRALWIMREIDRLHGA
jgi:hypothetical protein